MSKKNETSVQEFAAATHGAIWSGDHVVWTETGVIDGVTVTIRREGIAHHRDSDGDWRTAEGGRIADGEGESTTITIRRPITKEG